MLFAETYAFAREMGLPLPADASVSKWASLLSLVKWLVGAGVAVGIGYEHGLALGVLTYAAWAALTKYLSNPPVQRPGVTTKIYVKMRHAYTVALRAPACPVEIERAMSAAEAEGAVWPKGARALVERALGRNRFLWE